MKAVRIHEFGGSDRMQLEEVPLPTLKAGLALVRIRAAAVNPFDWMIRERMYNPEGADRVPMTLGQDMSGVIEQIGEGSKTDLKVGDEVFGAVWGSYAEYAAVPLTDLLRKPKGIDFVTAATIPMPAITAWQAVIDAGGAAPGKRFLIHGASGGVGSFAAQFAKWKGAQVIATASPPSFDWLKSIGIDQIIDYTRERFETKVHDLDVVLDPIGGEVQKRSWQVLKKGGLLINLIGEIHEAEARKYGVTGLEFGMEYDVEDLAEIASLVERGIVKPHIARVLPLAQAKQALDLNQRNESHGKIVLEVR